MYTFALPRGHLREAMTANTCIYFIEQCPLHRHCLTGGIEDTPPDLPQKKQSPLGKALEYFSFVVSGVLVRTVCSARMRNTVAHYQHFLDWHELYT